MVSKQNYCIDNRIWVAVNFTDADVADLRSIYDVDDDVGLFPTREELIMNVEDWGHYSNGWYGVLFMRDGVLYENEAGHDSVTTLSGQWNPDSITLEMIARRPLGFLGVPLKEVVERVRDAGYTGQ
jgi:hypothetical protein